MTTAIWTGVAQGISNTVAVTIYGFLLGAIFGVPVLMLRNSNVLVARWTGRALIEIVRGVPMLVWLFLIYNGPTQFDPRLSSVFTSWSASVIALGLISSVYIAEIYRGSLKAIHGGQWEASHALGMSGFDTVTRVIAPQVVRVAIPTLATYGISLLKDSSLVSTIGVFEITYYATTLSAETSSPAPFFAAGAYYLMITIPAVWGARRLDRRLRGKVVR